MQKLLPLLMLPIFFGIISCNQNSEEHCPENDIVPSIIADLSDSTAIVNSADGGIRTYSWDNGSLLASTRYPAKCILELYIDGNFIIDPIDVTIYKIVGEDIVAETIAGTPDVSGTFTYYYSHEEDLSETYEGCTGGFDYRLSISFASNGQTLEFQVPISSMDNSIIV